MEFKELTYLKIDDSTQTFDITKNNFVMRQDILDQYPNLIFEVTEFYEMRIDTIAKEIYDDVNLSDFIMLLNGIDNMLSISRGLILKYVPTSQIPAFRSDRTNNDTIRTRINSNSKQTKIDPKRVAYTNDTGNKSLPPTITESDYNPIKYKDGKVILGEGIFNI